MIVVLPMTVMLIQETMSFIILAKYEEYIFLSNLQSSPSKYDTNNIAIISKY
jgi:hypothetical protein